MEVEKGSSSNSRDSVERHQQQQQQQKRHRSIFDLPTDFFDSCRLLRYGKEFATTTSSYNSSSSSSQVLISEPFISSFNPKVEILDDKESKDLSTKNVPRWSCNTCKVEFESLQDQRSHFKSDIHRYNVKRSLAGKDILKEEDLDELTSDSFFQDDDISSISGSEDEDEKEAYKWKYLYNTSGESLKHKLYIRLLTGERVSVWKCLFLDESENILYENDKLALNDNDNCSKESEVIEKVKSFIHEPRVNTILRIVLLASGGHFAGCVFNGTSIVAHKTFHRYVVRAKSGKKQSSKDASGKAVHSAGASLRRHNELALKKEIQDLLASWKPYFDTSTCVFIYAPSNNRQLLFNGEMPFFSHRRCVIRNVPLTVRRPTLKEAKRIYNHLTQISYEIDGQELLPVINEDPMTSVCTVTNKSPEPLKEESCSRVKGSDELSILSDSEGDMIGRSTLLHEAAKSGNAQRILELLEEGLDPCVKDERGRTPYMVANEKEVRNTFRRFMALNLNKWDWDAAKVPSALTKEMEESQAAKQAEKDARKKARAKELKKLRKAKEKKAQAEAAVSKNVTSVSENQLTPANLKGQSESSGARISKEEELKRRQAEEREKRAAAAERRIAAASAQNAQGIATTDLKCSCCNGSLAGIVPFHRYNYKYCSSSCMHVHREILEDR